MYFITFFDQCIVNDKATSVIPFETVSLIVEHTKDKTQNYPLHEKYQTAIPPGNKQYIN